MRIIPIEILFGADRSGKTYCFDCSDMVWWMLVLSSITKWHQNSSGLLLNNAKRSIEIVTQLRLWSFASTRGNLLADSFFIPKWSHRAIWYAYSFHDLTHFQSRIGLQHLFEFLNCFSCSYLSWVSRSSAILVLFKHNEIQWKSVFITLKLIVLNPNSSSLFLVWVMLFFPSK